MLHRKLKLFIKLKKQKRYKNGKNFSHYTKITILWHKNMIELKNNSLWSCCGFWRSCTNKMLCWKMKKKSQASHPATMNTRHWNKTLKIGAQLRPVQFPMGARLSFGIQPRYKPPFWDLGQTGTNAAINSG